MERSEFTLDARRVAFRLVVICAVLELGFVLLDGVVNVEKGSSSRSLRRLFNITREDGLPSMFGVAQTFAVALSLWVLYAISRSRVERAAVSRGWLTVAVFFSYIAIDDGSKLHERLGSAFSGMAERGTEGGWASQLTNLFPSYTWQILLGPILLVMGLFLLVFLLRVLVTPGQRLMVISALALLVAAVGLDFIEGVEHGHVWLTEALGTTEYYVAHYLKSIEETIEMFAMTLFLATFLLQISYASPETVIRFTRQI